MAVDQSRLRAVSIFNGLAPGDLPKSLYIELDFTAAGSIGADIEIDLELFEQEAHLSIIQAVSVSNVSGGQDFTLTAHTSQHAIMVQSGRQAMLPMFAPSKTKFLGSTGGLVAAGIIKVWFLNVPIPAIIW